jgi:hypothetical protein
MGTDQVGSLPGCAQPQPLNLGEDIGECRRPLLLYGRFDDREQFPLQRPVIPLGALTQPLDHLIGGILDGY